MKKIKIQLNRLAAASLLLFSLALAPLAVTAQNEPSPPADTELVVKFKDAKLDLETRRGQAKAAEVLEDESLSLEAKLEDDNITLVKADVGTDVQAKIDDLEDNPAVEYAQPNYRYKTSASPNDPHALNDWWQRNISQSVLGLEGTYDADVDVREAWDLERSSWTDTKVAVIDSGAQLDHPDLQHNLIGGWDFTTDDASPDDTQSHGTMVSGVIAAHSNNSVGIAGSSYHNNLKVMPLKAQADGEDFLDTFAIIDAIGFAEEQGAKIINASWACITDLSDLDCGDDLAMYDAISAFSGLFVTSAANGDGGDLDFEGDNLSTEHNAFPCNFDLPNLVCVAATTQDDELTDWSNFGSVTVDLAAPGESIYTTDLSSGYEYVDGTSFSSPITAGAAGLLWSYRPSLTTAQVKAIILNSGDRLAALTGKTASGRRINFYKALAALDLSAPSGKIEINNDKTTTRSAKVTLNLNAKDNGFGMAYMRFSNDSRKWSAWQAYSSSRPKWSLTSSTYGGKKSTGKKRVYAQFRDKVKRVSALRSDAINYRP